MIQDKHFTIRPTTWDDFNSVFQLIKQHRLDYYGITTFSEDHLYQAWEDNNFDLSTDAWIVVPSDDAILGYADVMHATCDEIFVDVYAIPNQHAPAITAQLLEKAEERAIHHPEKPAKIKCRVSDVDDTLKSALDDAGYSRYLSFLMMQTELSAPPATPEWADGITVRPFVPHEDDLATYLVDEATSLDKGYSSPMTFEEWSKRMNLHGDSFDPTLWFLACSGDDIVGVALNNYQSATETGWIDHLGVVRDYRQKGIGKALMLHSFGAFYERGITRIRLNVDSASMTNAPRLYENVGMKTVQQYHFYEKALSTA